MEESTSTARLRFIGRRLRELRDDQRLTLVTAGRQIERSSSSLCLIENGQQPLRIRDLKHILDQYGLHDHSALRHDLLELAHQQAQQGWWAEFKDLITPCDADFASLEFSAAEMDLFDRGFIPGILQIEEYARSIMRSTRSAERLSQTERWIAYRLGRQQILSRPNPPRIRIVLDEAALRRTRGSPEIMRAQLDHLLQETEREGVSLQVLPFASTSDPGTNESFRTIRIGSPTILSVVLLTQLAGQRLLEEPSDLEGYAQVFEHVREAALSESESRAMIGRVISAI